MLCRRLLKDDTFADAGYILEMMTQASSCLQFLPRRKATLMLCFCHDAKMTTKSTH